MRLSRIGITVTQRAASSWRKTEPSALCSTSSTSLRPPTSSSLSSRSAWATDQVRTTNHMVMTLNKVDTEEVGMALSSWKFKKCDLNTSMFQSFASSESPYFSSSDKPSPWMSVDTALFLMTAGETKEDSTLVCFTESKDKEVCYESGRYTYNFGFT